MADSNTTGNWNDEIQYSILEMNQRLFDSIINASVRYGCTCNQADGSTSFYLRQFNLADVLPLVPDKDKTPLRILTFLNKENPPQAEVWIFFSKNSTDWMNVSYWKKLPINDDFTKIYTSLGNLQKALTDEGINRVNADTALQAQINELKVTPDVASNLKEQIEAETLARQQADKQLSDYFFNLQKNNADYFTSLFNQEKEERRKEDDRLEQLIRNINLDPTQTYIRSSSLKGIEVVEQAPSILNDFLYFEYSEIPETAEYNFTLSKPEVIANGVPTQLSVTLATQLIGKSGVDRVRILVQSERPQDAHIDVNVSDSLGTPFSFRDEGWWGPENGFNIPMDYSATTNMQAVFTAPGNYVLTFRLVRKDDGITIAENKFNVEVS